MAKNRLRRVKKPAALCNRSERGSTLGAYRPLVGHQRTGARDSDCVGGAKTIRCWSGSQGWKTAIAEGLAKRIVDEKVPEVVAVVIYSLDLGALWRVPSTEGDFEKRFKAVLADKGNEGVYSLLTRFTPLSARGRFRRRHGRI